MASVGAPKGNKNAVKGRLFEDVIRRALLAGDAVKLRAIVDKLVDKAVEGDMQAATMLIERMDGKITQPVEHAGEGGGPIMAIVSSSAELLAKLRGDR